VDSRTLLKQMLVQGDRVMKPAAGVTVLIYHRVGGGTGGEVDLDVDAFRAQLEHLRTHHTVIDLDAAAAVLEGDGAGGGADLPEGAVVVTFDDGTDDFCDVVVPALVEYGVPAPCTRRRTSSTPARPSRRVRRPPAGPGCATPPPPGSSRSGRTRTPTHCSTGPIRPRSGPNSTARSS